MKNRYNFLKQIVIILCFVFSNKVLISQTVNVPYQFYHDVNNNCIYDSGDTLLYNLPGNIKISYLNSAATTNSTSNVVWCTNSLTVSNPSVPAVNSTTFTNWGPGYYPFITVNSTCSSYSNLSYTATNYLPIKTINQMSDVWYSAKNVSSYYGSSVNNIFPICFNNGNDSMEFSLTFMNLYTCNNITSTRTFSLYFDGILYEQITTIGASYSTVNGIKTTINENYNPYYDDMYFKLIPPPGISALGNHTFTLKSTNLFNYLNTAINYSCILNSVPCSKISGQFYNDCNANCTKDGGDMTVSIGVKALITNGTSNYNISPDVFGGFSCYLASNLASSLTSFSINPSYTPCASAVSTINIPAGATTNTITLGYKNNSYAFDPIPYLASSSFPFFPGTSYTLAANVYFSATSGCNTPTLTNPGKVKFFLDKSFIFQNVVSPTPLPNSILPGPGGDTLVWNEPNFYTSAFNYSFVATVSPTVIVGTVFEFASIIQPTYDDKFSNNIFNTGPHGIGLPYDPNGKECYAQGIQPNGDIPFGVQNLEYTIHFQNIGTAVAKNVTTLDTLDSNLDWTTLQVLSSSFPVQTQVDNSSGQTIFYFKNINLPDSTSSPQGSQGFVRYSIKLKSGVPVNTIIKNRAHNYFDFNAPVPTNQTKNKLVLFAGINEVELSNSIKLLPNPVNDKLFISCEQPMKELSIINSLGQLVFKQEVSDKQTSVEMNSLPRAFYFVSITLNSGQVITKKVIKN